MIDEKASKTQERRCKNEDMAEDEERNLMFKLIDVFLFKLREGSELG